ncbi:MAG: hypothetical protein AMXMBFR82_20520 [Candidatus Hydrogenedentota bacterium]
MRKQFVFIALALCVGIAAAQPSADHATAPPITTKAGYDAALHALPPDLVEAYLQFVGTSHVFDNFEGQNSYLKSMSDSHKQLLVGSGFEVDLDSAALFGEGIQDGPYTVYETAISSLDAESLRFLVDLSQLQEGEEAWVIDMSEPRAFGPYGASDAHEDGRWLPTTVGESAVLMVRTTGDTVPQIRLIGVSHFFERFEDALKLLPCNNNVICESNATVQDVMTGVGMMVVPQGGFDQALCTGSLINNSDTAALEPYFLTSWHCVPDYVDADEVDIIWDYRATACDTNDPPSLASLPRSEGEVVLTTNNGYDLTLMRLLSVPSGTLGRTYLGWETRDPVFGEDVVTIHYPDGSHERISYGEVVGIDQSSGGFVRQTKLQWYDGVTEGGSSGSPMLLVASSYHLAGTLSNGPTHSCTNTAGNVDWYTSFRDFFPQAEGWLTGTNPPPPDGPGPGITTCPAAKVFKDNPEILQNLRTLRDQGLLKTAWGKPVVDAYYAAAPYLARLVDWSPVARDTFKMAAAPFAALGAKLS